MSNTLGKSIVPLIHKHRCIEHIYILVNPDDQNQLDWMKDYSKIRDKNSSIQLLLELTKQDIDSLMQRPSRWSRSKALLTELCLQTSQTNLSASMIDNAPREDLSTLRIITLFFGNHRLFSQSSSQIQKNEFNNIDECIQSIEANISTTVFLIIFFDGSNDMSSLFELKAIHAVYIVRGNNWNEQIESISKHSKVSGVFGLDEDLLEQLTADICFYRHMQFHIPVINTFHIGSNITSKLDEHQINFLFFQLFSDILPYAPEQSNFVEDSTTENDNRLFSLLIDTNITISNLLNRFNISTLQTSVSKLQKINQRTVPLSKTTDSSSITVYRAQLVSKKDFDIIRNNVNILLSIPTFILASRSFRTVADICRRAVDNQLTVILFELNLSENVCIANLGSDTVAFSLGTLFRLVSAESAVDGVFHAQLESADGAIEHIKEQLQSKIGGRLTWLTFGNYLAYLKKFDVAIEYCKYLLNLFPKNHPSLASIYNNMALIYSATSDDQNALDCFEKAVSMNVSSSSTVVDQRSLPAVDSSPNRIEILNKMAEISYRLGNQGTALDFYRQALEITTDVDSQQFYKEKIRALLFHNIDS